jgi:RNA polymerase-binding transcription factor
MRKPELDVYRKILEDKMAELYRSAHRIVRDSQRRELFDQDEARDEGDEAQRVLLRDARMSLGERDAALAQQIEAALRRITRGEFGICVDCGRPIEKARLKLVPWAMRCVADQEANEFEGRDRSPSL